MILKDVEGKDGTLAFSNQSKAWDWLLGIGTQQSGKLVSRKGLPKAVCQKSPI